MHLDDQFCGQGRRIEDSHGQVLDGIVSALTCHEMERRQINIVSYYLGNLQLKK